MPLGVVQEVTEDAGQLAAAAQDLGHGLVVGHHLGRHPVRRSAPGHLLPYECRQVEEGVAGLFARVEPGEQQQVGGEVLQAYHVVVEIPGVQQPGVLVGDLYLGAQRGDGAAEFVGGVGDEAVLAFDGLLQRGQGLVRGAGEAADLVAGAGYRDPPGQVAAAGDRGHLGADALDRAQGAPGDQPGHAYHDEQQERQGGEHGAGDLVEGGLFVRERGAA